MRLIADFKDEKLAYQFHYFLLQEGIGNLYDSAPSSTTQEKIYHIWIIEEGDMPAALDWLSRYQQNPDDLRFHKEIDVKSSVAPPGQPFGWKIKVDAKKKPPQKKAPLTLLIIVVCSLLFFINSMQQRALETKYGKIALQLGVTPLQKETLFDYPKYLEDMEKFWEEHSIRSIEDIKTLPPDAQADYLKIVGEPTWKGVSELISTHNLKGWEELPSKSLFGKIRQGEYWRLFTPCLMHNGLFHILFNMAWVWLLGRQIEERLGKLRTLSIILLAGIIPNIAQYIMGGPIFEGFSGVVVGFVGFIWMRQKIAPWEGYPLQRSVVLFIAIYVFAMLGLEILSFTLQYFHIVELVLPIANTAHIVGGLIGILCGRLPFFARSRKL